jgi:hypothetical protein
LGYKTYNSGKEGLLTERSRVPKDYERDSDRNSREWKATYAGCKKDSFSHFFDSLVWPYSFASEALPSLVIKLNPRPEDKKPPTPSPSAGPSAGSSSTVTGSSSTTVTVSPLAHPRAQN